MTYFYEPLTDEIEPTETYPTRTLDECVIESAASHRALRRYQADPLNTFVRLAVAVEAAETEAELVNIARFVNQFEPLANRLPGVDAILFPIACREAQARAARQARGQRSEWDVELENA